MPTTLLKAAVGAGKTEAALSRLTDSICNPGRPFAKAWVLLASRRQELAFRQRLIDWRPDTRQVYFNAEFFNFYELNARLLNLAGQPARRINEAAALGLLRHVVFEVRQQGQLSLFEGIATSPGFGRLLSQLINELKQNQVDPDAFAAAARSQKDHEIALIYQRYQALLRQHELVDREGEGWLALDTLRDSPELARDVDLIVVDGYDQFTPVQAEMLARLSQRSAELLITLTAVPGREDIIGQRFERAEKRLTEAHQAIGAQLHTQIISEEQPRHPQLRQLSEGIGAIDLAPVRPAAGTPALHLLEAPDVTQEAASVMRRIKALLLAGARPDEILVVVRDWPRYQSSLQRSAKRYELPVLLHYSETLVQNPVVDALMKLLALAGGPREGSQLSGRFKRRELFELLHSPYIRVPGLAEEDVATLDRISRARQILSGNFEDIWRHALNIGARDYEDEEGEALPDLNIDDMKAADLSLAIQDFMDAITPEPQGSIDDYVAWIEDLIGPDPLLDPADDPDEDILPPYPPFTISMLAAIRDSEDAGFVARDLAAMQRFKQILRGFVEMQSLLGLVAGRVGQSISWADFWADLQAAVAGSSEAQRSPIRSGRVLVTSAADSRGLPHEHVFILGMAEGIFPALRQEDPLYLDREREAMQARGVLLQTQAERAEDTGLFYELINLPRATLTLSRPTIRNGKYWNESHLWRLAVRVFEPDTLPLSSQRVGQPLVAADAASMDEALLAAMITQDEALLAWLAEQDQTAEAWRQVQHGRATEARRLSRMAHDAYTGHLQAPESQALVQQILTPDYKWSASRINDYGACGFRFFAKRLLNLETLDDPQTGMDVLQRGSIYHAILEKTYQAILDEQLEISPEPDAQVEAVGILNDIADEVFRSAPQRYQFRAGALWAQEQREMLRRLEKLVVKDFSKEAPAWKAFAQPRRPYGLEWRFGYDAPLYLPLNDADEADAESAIWVRGSIDRIDRVDDMLIVVDYKSGSTKIAESEISAGRNVQMMIYLLALRQMLAQHNPQNLSVGAGFFWHIQSSEDSGLMNFESKDTAAHEETLAAGRAQVLRYLQQGRQGQFAVQATRIEEKRCTRYCEYQQFCRISQTNQYKGNPHDHAI